MQKKQQQQKNEKKEKAKKRGHYFKETRRASFDNGIANVQRCNYSKRTEKKNRTRPFLLDHVSGSTSVVLFYRVEV